MSQKILSAMQDLDKLLRPLTPEEREQVTIWAAKKYAASQMEQVNAPPPVMDTKAKSTAEDLENPSKMTGIYYFDKAGGLVVNARKYIDKIRSHEDEGSDKK